MPVGHGRDGRTDRLVGRGLPDEGLFDRVGPQGRAHVGQADAGLGDRAALAAHRGRDADDRPLVADPDELLVVRAPAVCFGTRICVSSSPSPTAVVKRSSKKSSAATVRVEPSAPAMTSSASSASAGAPTSVNCSQN